MKPKVIIRIKDAYRAPWNFNPYHFNAEMYVFPAGRADKYYLLLYHPADRTTDSLTYKNLVAYALQKGRLVALWSVDWRDDGGHRPVGKGLSVLVGLSPKMVKKRAIRTTLTSLDAFAVYGSQGRNAWQSQFFDGMTQLVAERQDAGIVHEFPTLVVEQDYVQRSMESHRRSSLPVSRNWETEPNDALRVRG